MSRARVLFLFSASVAVAIVMVATGVGVVPVPAQAPNVSTDTLVLSNFTLIDGNGGAPLANAALVAEAGRITWIGPASQLKAPAGSAVQDLTGKYVMPGIIDLHVHVSNADGLVQDPRKFFTRDGVETDLKLFASYGVTSVVSLGTDQPIVYQIRAEQRASRPKMARIFTAGKGFTVTDGFPTNPGNVPGVPYEVSNLSQVAGDVEELAANRPDVVKVWVDDRFGDFKKTPIALSSAIIKNSHQRGLKVMAHVFYLEDAKRNAAAGLDAMAHSVRDRVVDEELIGLMKKHGTWLVPTLTRDVTTFAWAEPGPFLADPFFTRAAPPLFLAALKTPGYHNNLVADKHFPEYPGYLKNSQQNLKRLVDAGVRYGFGTDGGPPGRPIAYLDHWEMELMAQAGLTPMQIITAATRSGAEFLGQKDLGTLERGKWADILVLGRDPLADIRNSRSIDSVYVAGNRVP